MTPAPVAPAFDTGLVLPDALAGFADVAPAILDERALQQRVDRKYLLPMRLLDPLLAQLRGDYGVLRSAGRLAASYNTRYFDTPDRRFYEDHRRGRRPRHKVRVRHHLDRELTFLETKKKGADERTLKARTSRPFGHTDLDAVARAFVAQHCPIPANLLVPRLSIAFRRLTLVGEHINERVTFDWDFALEEDGRRDEWPAVVIAEVKQARYDNRTPSTRAFRTLGIREFPISKYCLATARLAPVRSHPFKPALRAVEHLSA